MSEFSARVAHRDAATVVELAGDVDYGSSREVTELVQRVLADPMSELVIDLREVTFIDSVGVAAAIASPSREAKAGGIWVRVEVNDAVRMRLHLMGLDDLLDRTDG